MHQENETTGSVVDDGYNHKDHSVQQQQKDHHRKQQEQPNMTTTPSANINDKQEQQQLPPDSWREAHLQTCRQQQSLSATPLQVLQLLYPQEAAPELPSRNEVVVVLEQDEHEDGQVEGRAVAQAWNEQQEQQQEQQASPSSSSWSASLARMTRFLLRQLYKVIDEEPDDSDLEEHVWTQDNDNAMTNIPDYDENEDSNKVALDETVLNMELTIACCKALLQRRRRHQDAFVCESVASPAVAAMYMEEQQHHSKDAPCLIQWCQEMGQQQQQGGKKEPDDDDDVVVSRILENVTRHEANILAHALVHTGHAVFGNEEKTILVLLDSSSTTQSKEQDFLVDVEVTKLQLLTAQHATERQIQQWTKQAAMAGKRAMEAKKKSPRRGGTTWNKKVLMEMRTRRLLLEKIEASRNTVLTLEQTYHGLEQAHSQRQVMTCLKTSLNVLQSLGTSTGEKTVEDVMENLQEEMEAARIVQETLATEQQLVVVDEEELLQELEELSLISSSPPDNNNNNSNEKKPVASEQKAPPVEEPESDKRHTETNKQSAAKVATPASKAPQVEEPEPDKRHTETTNKQSAAKVATPEKATVAL